MIKNRTLKILGLVSCFIFITACENATYSVFSGGTGGLVVDAESTSNPKAGIANVEVYAFIDCGERDSNFNNWKEGTIFNPSGHYGHTTTNADGSFSISKIVWQTNDSDFGKDGDYQKVFFLFYSENYGLTKGETVIVSDSISDNVYAELTAIRKSTVLNMNFVDVATGNNTGNAVFVKVTVPQTTASNTTAVAKVYDVNIVGSGAITVSYPRWQNDENKAAGIETSPEITVSYKQSSDTITWKGCYNADNATADYSFREDAATGIKKTIGNSAFSMTFYGKATRFNIPNVSGQYSAATPGNSATSADDGVEITMKGKDSGVDLGQVTTYSQNIGNGVEKHGVFSGLGSGYTWTDTAYTGKYSTLDVKITGGVKSLTKTLRSDATTYTVQLQ